MPTRRPVASVASGLALFGLLALPAGAAALEPGHLLVVTDLGELASVDPSSGAIAPFATAPFAAGGRLAFDARGDALLRDRYTGAVVRFDRATGDAVPVVEAGALPNSGGLSSGLALDAAGDLFLTTVVPVGPSSLEGQVLEVGGATGTPALLAAGPYGADVIAVEAGGQLLVTDAVIGGLGLLRVDPATGVETQVSPGGWIGHPLDLELAPDGAIVLLDADNGLLRVDPASGEQQPVAFSALLSARAFALDGGGGYYLVVLRARGAFQQGGIVHLSASGDASPTTAATAFFAPFDVAVVPVPEPGGPLGVASGLVVLALRSRARVGRGSAGAALR